MSVANVTEHSLCIQVAQILDGDAECVYCDRDAVLLVATGADPDYEPVCIGHGGELMDSCVHMLRKLFVKNAA